MKAVSVPIDWLRQIDGLSVADAIEFLSTLPPDHTLNYWQSAGDDQGVEIISGLMYKRPYTEQELAEMAAQRKAKKLKEMQASLAYYETQRDYFRRVGESQRAASYQKDVDCIRQKIEELK